MKNNWLYSIEAGLPGEENMGRDEAIALACQNDGIPRLRIYSWHPYTLSLGYGQQIEQIDTEALNQRGFGLVRRPTGGRAVFHAEEVTYAVAMASGGEGIHETYARINNALRLGFELLGATEIEFSRSQPEFRTHYALDESASCFSASALNELMWHGRKLVGSAQRRYGATLLQHGSILTGNAHLEIVDLLRLSSGDNDRRTLLRTRLAEKTATLADVMQHDLPPFVVIAEALCKGFAAEFEVEMVEG